VSSIILAIMSFGSSRPSGLATRPSVTTFIMARGVNVTACSLPLKEA
jgi:hypothetical protein